MPFSFPSLVEIPHQAVSSHLTATARQAVSVLVYENAPVILATSARNGLCNLRDFVLCLTVSIVSSKENFQPTPCGSPTMAHTFESNSCLPKCTLNRLCLRTSFCTLVHCQSLPICNLPHQIVAGQHYDDRRLVPSPSVSALCQSPPGCRSGDVALCYAYPSALGGIPSNVCGYSGWWSAFQRLLLFVVALPVPRPSWRLLFLCTATPYTMNIPCPARKCNPLERLF